MRPLQTGRAAVLDFARRVCAAVEQGPEGVGERIAWRITVSAGVAALPEDGKLAAEPVGAADRALYAAKACGRNRAVGFNPR